MAASLGFALQINTPNPSYRRCILFREEWLHEEPPLPAGAHLVRQVYGVTNRHQGTEHPAHLSRPGTGSIVNNPIRIMRSTRAVRFLIIIVIALTGEGILAIVPRHIEVDSQSLHRAKMSYLRLFALTAEAHVPTGYSSVLRLATNSLLASIAYVSRESHDAFRSQRTVLAFVFLRLPIVEVAQVHELVAGECTWVEPSDSRS